MTAPRTAQHWLLLSALVAMWGSAPAGTAIAVATLPPLVVVAGRTAIGSILVIALMALRRDKLPLTVRHWVFFTASALFGYALPFTLIGWGQTRIPSGLTAVFFAVMPLTTILLAHFFVEGERLTRRKLGGFVVGFIGILVLVGPDVIAELSGSPTLLIYELAILAGPICFAIHVIIARRRPPCDEITATGGVLIMATVLTLPTALWFYDPAGLAPSDNSMIAVACLAVGATVVPTIAFFRLVTLTGASFVALINYLIPWWGLLVGITIMGDPFEPRALAALALILVGIALAERR